MKVVLAPFGSRGDVEPMIALGEVLRGRGHEVVFCVLAEFVERIRNIGFECHRGGPAFGKFFDGTQNEFKTLWQVFKTVPEQFSALKSACVGADAVVGAMLQFAAPSVAEILGIPYFYAVFSPAYFRTTALPPLGLAVRSFPAWAHRALWGFQDALTPVLGGILNRERRALGLGGIKSLYHYLLRPETALPAFDPELTPVPEDIELSLSPGVWRGRECPPLEPDLDAFLNAGPPPVFVGFGSMNHRNPRQLMELGAVAARRAGFRALLASPCRTKVPEGCFLLDEVPHAALFPRVAAVVHHGGVGTTVSAALAGVPQLVVPHLADQFYHAFRVADLGLGPEPIRFRRLNLATLAHRLQDIAENKGYTARARDFALRMRPFDGVERAADAVVSGPSDKPYKK
jgi:UDP:flavonoid glycosyltransferase YjiC (YdhE family)